MTTRESGDFSIAITDALACSLEVLGFYTERYAQEHYLRTAGGQLIPMSAVISLAARVEPNDRTQYQQLNSTTLSGIMMPPNTLGTGLQFLQAKLEEIAPRGFRVGYRERGDGRICGGMDGVKRRERVTQEGTAQSPSRDQETYQRSWRRRRWC